MVTTRNVDLIDVRSQFKCNLLVVSYSPQLINVFGRRLKQSDNTAAVAGHATIRNLARVL
jgi:hypothetical protein